MALFGRGGEVGEGLLSAEALVLSNDAGFSAMSWWVTTAYLRVAIAGREPVYVEATCTVHREKSLLAGSVLPVQIDPGAPERLKVRWHEVPTIEQRIGTGDAVVLDPQRTWQSVAEARAAAPTRTAARAISQPPPSADPWGNGQIANWPPDRPLEGGRRAGTALVVSSSIDSRGYRAAEDWHFPVSRYAGTIYDTPHEYLGWLVLCVVPESGPRYGLHVRKMLRGSRLGAVLPVAIHPDKPGDIEFPWRYAPDTVRANTERMLAANQSALETADERLAGQAAASETALGAIEDHAVREQTAEMLRKFGMG